MTDARSVLITGAGGYLGGRLAEAWLERTDAPVILWLHARDEAELAARSARVLPAFARFGSRVCVRGGDLRGSDPFRQVDTTTVRLLVHAAAVTRFNVDRETAQRVNVQGARYAMELARRCPGLEGFGLLSSIYASGLAGGRLEEARLAPHGFANSYEWSKWASEEALIEDFPELPWQIFRVATVLCEDESGRVAQHNAVHNTLKLLYHGLLSTVPGRPGTPLYFVTTDFVVESVLRLLQPGFARSFWHVAHPREASLTLGETLDVALEQFETREAFRRRGSPRPLYLDEEAFLLLADTVARFAGPVVSQAVSSVSPFAKQLFVEKDLRNDRLARALEGYRAPDARRVLERACADLIETRWKEKPCMLRTA